MTDQPFKVLVVGGGAGGLELACKLGRKWGPERVALVDAALFHIWKPSLHEVAAGTLDIHQEGLSYQMLAHDNGFSFVYGAMTGVDTGARQLVVAAVMDGAEEVLPERRVGYEQLVLAIGSVSNDFGVPGVASTRSRWTARTTPSASACACCSCCRWWTSARATTRAPRWTS